MQAPDQSLGGYSHRERWSRTRWKFSLRKATDKTKRKIIEYIFGGKHQESGKIFESIFGGKHLTPIGSAGSHPKKSMNPKKWVIPSAEQRHPIKMLSERVRRDKILNAMIAKIHEGKTPGSILCGVVPAPECALPPIIHIDDMMKNPSGRVGYPINLTGIQQIGKTSAARPELRQYTELEPGDSSLK